MKVSSEADKSKSIVLAFEMACSAFLAPANTIAIPFCNVVQRNTNCAIEMCLSFASELNSSIKVFTFVNQIFRNSHCGGRFLLIYCR